MGSANPSLPIIDISPYLTPSSSADSRLTTTRALASACYEHGFFYLTGHDIPPATTAKIISHARTFFTEASQEAKNAIKRQDPGVGVSDGARGYQVTGENVTKGARDWHEAVDLYRPVVDGEEAGLQAEDLEVVAEKSGKKTAVLNAQGRTKTNREPPFKLLEGINLWPSHPQDFREVYIQYIEDIQRVGTAVLQALGEALELRDPSTFVNATRNSYWVMRAIGYPQLDASLAAEGGVSCGVHSDYGCLTLLLADETRGALQVLKRKDEDGGEQEWIAADPIEGAYVVNVGDMVELWTNGLVKSTLHRVVHTGQNYRVSVPFFLEPDLDAMVEPLPECVERSGRKRIGEKVRYGDHLAAKVGGNFYGAGSKA